MLASVSSVGDAYDNALAESFVDSFKTELIADRVWRLRSQLELAVVEYIDWYSVACLHESLGDIPPLEYEQRHAEREPITLASERLTQQTRPRQTRSGSFIGRHKTCIARRHGIAVCSGPCIRETRKSHRFGGHLGS